ncbi:MAG TPA: TAT-variant-translocated molybdopterin oxidoreductase [Chitinophagaceae bacterium]|nr:TAT-variant-translocated molybdopterin oxidoreductase [Chitinophagaceae bacterium]
MSKKKYWQSFGELNQTESFQESTKNEFKEELLPLADLDDKGILDAKTPRRDFLKYLGFSTAAAAVAASCEVPVRKAVPYLNKPDGLIPGVPNYYASTYVNGGDTISVVVKQRDGRPIKIEGNELSTITNGGTNAQAQASVLDLYDNTRLRYPMQKDGKGFKEVTGFDAFDKMVGAAIAGKSVAILTSTVNSPSTLAIISEFLAKYPGSRHVQYDAVSYSGMLLANEACYGKKAIPSYHFDNAKVIVSLGADFLGTWLSPTEFSGQYAKNRKITGEKPELSRHFQFESMMSMTGSNADDRFTHKPSETGAVVLALAAKLGVAVSAPSIADAKLAKGIETAAAALNASKGSALVVCGSNDTNIQVIVNAINEAIGANGTTINWAMTSNYKNGIDGDMVKLVDDMNAGTIGAVLINGVNPAYSYNDSKKFKDALAKLVSVSFNGTMDETTEQCKYILPSHHWLESWGDAEPKTGYFSLLQPTINPLFKTRAFQTSLIKWSAAAGSMATDYESYFKTYWNAKLGSSDLYNKALQDGVVEPAAMPVGGGSYNNAALAAAEKAAVALKGGPVEIVLYQKVSVGDGTQANNPWLQELPDPVSKVTWDNYAMISPAYALELLGLDVMNQEGGKQSDYEVHPEKPVVKITVGKNSVELPVIVIPGMNKYTVALAVGYGRQSAKEEDTKNNIGRSANGAGKNVYPFVSFNGTNLYSSEAKVEKTSTKYPLAQTQVHGFTESRPVIYETSLKAYNANPAALLAAVTHERLAITANDSKDFVKDATMYPDFEKPGIKWGMSIDLNTCTGCSACVVACTAENNVSVVGKMQVQRAHEMHWLRIDRYFTGDLENPDVVFQPMLCQHCDNAPCENVCPVAATNHSSEGLNQMTYNRCIGTRYCANNCPYKVRRFNWLDYTGADSFKDNMNPMVGTYMDESVLQMNDDLTRMVLNPDVTVRSRGVIEKCSFCVQRLQETKLEAKKQQDPKLVRNVKTACMQACPAHAISFGNVNDKESDVYKIRNVDQAHRSFYVMEQLHVLPNVSYLAKVRNTDRHIGAEEHHEEKKADPKGHA